MSLNLIQEEVMAEGDCESAGYNYDQCLDSSIRQLLKEETNCTVPWLYQNKDICKVSLGVVDIGTTQYICILSGQIHSECRLQTFPREQEESEGVMPRLLFTEQNCVWTNQLG